MWFTGTSFAEDNGDLFAVLTGELDVSVFDDSMKTKSVDSVNREEETQ
jgi:hypothetical protein